MISTDNKYRHIFFERLKDLREEKGLSQSALAREIKLITQSAITKWELQHTEPSATMLMIVADYFDVTVDYLLGREA